MDAQTQARLFDPFFSTKQAGRGLGLSVVLGIVRSQQGVIMVRSAPGKGTCIRVAFPLGSDQARRSRRSGKDAGTERTARMDGLTVLLVDDEESLLQMGRRILERAGAKVVSAADGAEAVALAQDAVRTWSCAVVDLTMPRMDGLQCCQELQRLDPELPLILTSGYAKEDVARRIGDQKLAGFLSKPYDARGFSQEIARVARPAASP